MKTDNEIISIREFARRVGVSDTAIHKAIKLGKISIVEDGKKKGINYQTGLHELQAFGIGGTKEKTCENITNLNADNATFIESKRREAFFKSELARLDLEEKNGTLVSKEQVYSDLFDFGNEVKNTILSIPDRIIDELITLSKDRNAAHNLLTYSLTDALTALSEKANKVNM